MQVKLKVVNGSNSGRELNVAYDEFVVGRHEDCHLRPKSDSISRRHCVIRTREGRVFIEDLGSRNGTFIDNQRCQGEVEATNGSLLRIGRLEFVLIVEAEQVLPVPPAAGPQSVDGESSAEDNDITKWLEEGDVTAFAARKGDPETRQFRLDETERVALEAASNPSNDTKEQASTDEDTSEKTKKKEYGKLPPRSAAMSNTSREAAADMLKRFFNRP
jgi:pSer/pThr/pTyr-binding forkhead associated (FHA) protein